MEKQRVVGITLAGSSDGLCGKHSRGYWHLAAKRTAYRNESRLKERTCYRCGSRDGLWDQFAAKITI